MLMPERNNRRRKKLSYLLVYNLVVEIKKPYKQKTQKLDPKIIWSLHSVRCVPSEHRRGTGWWLLHESVKAPGRTEPLKGSPEWGREVSAFCETRVERKWCEKGINLGNLIGVKIAFLEWRVWEIGFNKFGKLCEAHCRRLVECIFN